MTYWRKLLVPESTDFRSYLWNSETLSKFTRSRLRRG
jgi:hypothetical protein